MTIGRYSFQRITKVIFFLGFITLADYGISQSTTFQLEGKINNIESGTIQIWYSKQDSIVINAEDSVPLISEKFDIKGQLAYPGLIIMSLTTDKYYESGWFYIDSGKQTLILEIIEDHLQVKSTGKTFNEFISNFKNQMDAFKKMENELINEYHLTWPQYLDYSSRYSELNINYFPSNFLLDHEGKIVAKNIAVNQLEEFLMKNLD